MKERVLKLINQIKDNLKEIDEDGVTHPLLDTIFDQLSLIEDEVYNEDGLDALDYGEDEY